MRNAVLAICDVIGLVVLTAFPAFAGIGDSVTGSIKEVTVGAAKDDVVAVEGGSKRRRWAVENGGAR